MGNYFHENWRFHYDLNTAGHRLQGDQRRKAMTNSISPKVFYQNVPNLRKLKCIDIPPPEPQLCKFQETFSKRNCRSCCSRNLLKSCRTRQHRRVYIRFFFKGTCNAKKIQQKYKQSHFHIFKKSNAQNIPITLKDSE